MTRNIFFMLLALDGIRRSSDKDLLVWVYCCKNIYIDLGVLLQKYLHYGQSGQLHHLTLANPGYCHNFILSISSLHHSKTNFASGHRPGKCRCGFFGFVCF